MQSRAFIRKLEGTVWEFLGRHKTIEPTQCVLVVNLDRLRELQATSAIGDIRHDETTGQWTWKGIRLEVDRFAREVTIRAEEVLVR